MDRKETKIITIASIKGGVGKSTFTIIFSKILAKKDKKVLIIDFDPQASTTSFFYDILEKKEIDIKKENCYTFLKGEFNPNLDKINNLNNIWFLPSHIDFAEFTAVHSTLKDFQLKRKLTPIKNNFDYIIIDCAPQVSSILNNALLVSNQVIIPVLPDKWALEGVPIVIRQLKELEPFLDNEENQTIENTLNIIFSNVNVHKAIDKSILKLTKSLYEPYLRGIIPTREQIKKFLHDLNSLENLNDEILNDFEKSLERVFSKENINHKLEKILQK